MVHIDSKDPTRSKYRIAIVTSIHSDFDSRIWKLSTSLADVGCEVHLICSWDVCDDESIKGVQMHSFPKVTRRIYRPVAIPFRVFKHLLPILKMVDVVHFHDLDLLPWMSFVSLFKPVIYDVHENYSEEMLVRDWIPKLLRVPLYYLVHYFQYFFSRIIRNIILVTPSQDAQFRHPRFRIFYLKNYASLSLLNEVKDNYLERPDVVIFVGTGYESNGSFLILEIASLMKLSGFHIKFLLPDRFQSDIFRMSFVQQMEDMDLNDMVSFFPNMLPHCLISILNQSTIALAPNLRVPKQEMAIPTKLFEYMAAGLPIVASDLPYQSKLLSLYRIGILAQPEDPHSFVRAITELVENRKLAFEIGRRGQQVFKAEYSWEGQIPALLNFYAEIVYTAKTLFRFNYE